MAKFSPILFGLVLMLVVDQANSQCNCCGRRNCRCCRQNCCSNGCCNQISTCSSCSCSNPICLSLCPCTCNTCNSFTNTITTNGTACIGVVAGTSIGPCVNLQCPSPAVCNTVTMNCFC